MRNSKRRLTAAGGLGGVCLAFCLASTAAPVYQPSGNNLVYGDVTHGQRANSASGNPAGAAADAARREGRGRIASSPSAVFGLEYGDVEELFDAIDELARTFLSDDEAPPAPGQNPDDTPDEGIDLGDFLDSLDDDTREAVDAIATEVAVQATLLGFIASEGYARATISGDVPLLLATGRGGGTWNLGLNWSGATRAFGVEDPIDFDFEQAVSALDEALSSLPETGPVPATRVDLTGGVILELEENLEGAALLFENDSALITKSSRSTEFHAGYSRELLSRDRGRLFVGATGRLIMMELSRVSARFGDLTDSQELFDEIRNADFVSDTRLAGDLGALWVAPRYQLGVQWRNINQPTFEFNDVETSQYQSEAIVRFLEADRRYQMDSQFKLEASMFTRDRKWSAHLGYDVDPVTDPVGDRFQWLTVSAAVDLQRWWLPALRFGWRQNLAGTERGYVGFGMTLFRYLDIDLASSLDTVRIDDTDLPQGVFGSIGFRIPL